MNRPRRARASSRIQRGEFNLPRILTICAILVAILLVPLYFWKDKAVGARPAVAQGPAAAAVDGRSAAPPAGVAPNDPDRFGLSFGWLGAADSDTLHASCHGEPKGLGRAQDSCDPHAGDISCRTELGLLCARAGDAGAPYALATTRAVAGFLLASRADADARCAAELGAGWRTATFHDAGGWELRGQRLPGTAADTSRRAWVAVTDQRANCWDRP